MARLCLWKRHRGSKLAVSFLSSVVGSQFSVLSSQFSVLSRCYHPVSEFFYFLIL